MLAISMKYECPSCGNVLKIVQPFSTKRQRKTAMMEDGPSKCGCGRKSGFKLLSFNPSSLVEDVSKVEFAEDESVSEE